MPLNAILPFVWKQQDNKHTACISIKEQVSIDLSIGNKFLNLTLPLVLRKNGITVLQCRMGHWWWSCGMELSCWDVQGATGMLWVLPHISPLYLCFTAHCFPFGLNKPRWNDVFLPFVGLAEKPYWYIMIFLSNYCLWLLIGEHTSTSTRVSWPD